MFGFDGNTEGLKKILERIAANPGEGRDAITHKEVRAYARCLIPLVPFLQVEMKLEPELKILLTSLCASGLPPARSLVHCSKDIEVARGERSAKK